MGGVKGLHVLIVVSFIQFVHHACCMTIDQMISSAATSSKQFKFLDDTGNFVQVELDMMFTLDRWRAIQRANSSSVKTSRQKRKAIREINLRWTNDEIPYEIPGGVFSNEDKQQINNAINDWQTYTCIKFRPSSSATNRVRFQDGGGCASYVGMSKGIQPIILASGCRQKGIIIHEIGHAVGFHHEQTRPDRDKYVRILRENIPESVYYNFQIYSENVINTFNVPYDYSSVMHYGSTAFSLNGGLTIQTIDPRFQSTIGSREGHSFNDIKLANLMYDCAAKNKCPKKTCPKEGFVGKDCNCWCPGSPVKVCDGKEIGGGGQTVGTREPVTEGPVTGNCNDMNSNCAGWAKRGECSKNAGIMSIHCKKTCNKCGEVKTCRDIIKGCDYYRSQGYCTQTFVQQMRTNCAKACGACGSDEAPNNPNADGGSTTPSISLLATVLVAIGTRCV